MTNSPHLSGIYIFMSIIYSGRCGLLFGLSGASFADTDLHLDDMMNEPYSPRTFHFSSKVASVENVCMAFIQHRRGLKTR